MSDSSSNQDLEKQAKPSHATGGFAPSETLLAHAKVASQTDPPPVEPPVEPARAEMPPTESGTPQAADQALWHAAYGKYPVTSETAGLPEGSKPVSQVQRLTRKEPGSTDESNAASVSPAPPASDSAYSWTDLPQAGRTKPAVSHDPFAEYRNHRLSSGTLSGGEIGTQPRRGDDLRTSTSPGSSDSQSAPGQRIPDGSGKILSNGFEIAPGAEQVVPLASPSPIVQPVDGQRVEIASERAAVRQDTGPPPGNVPTDKPKPRQNAVTGNNAMEATVSQPVAYQENPNPPAGMLQPDSPKPRQNVGTGFSALEPAAFEQVAYGENPDPPARTFQSEKPKPRQNPGSGYNVSEAMNIERVAYVDETSPPAGPARSDEDTPRQNAVTTYSAMESSTSERVAHQANTDPRTRIFESVESTPGANTSSVPRATGVAAYEQRAYLEENYASSGTFQTDRSNPRQNVVPTYGEAEAFQRASYADNSNSRSGSSYLGKPTPKPNEGVTYSEAEPIIERVAYQESPAKEKYAFGGGPNVGRLNTPDTSRIYQGGAGANTAAGVMRESNYQGRPNDSIEPTPELRSAYAQGPAPGKWPPKIETDDSYPRTQPVAGLDRQTPNYHWRPQPADNRIAQADPVMPGRIDGLTAESATGRAQAGRYTDATALYQADPRPAEQASTGVEPTDSNSFRQRQGTAFTTGSDTSLVAGRTERSSESVTPPSLKVNDRVDSIDRQESNLAAAGSLRSASQAVERAAPAHAAEAVIAHADEDQKRRHQGMVIPVDNPPVQVVQNLPLPGTAPGLARNTLNPSVARTTTSLQGLVATARPYSNRSLEPAGAFLQISPGPGLNASGVGQRTNASFGQAVFTPTLKPDSIQVPAAASIRLVSAQPFDSVAGRLIPGSVNSAGSVDLPNARRADAIAGSGSGGGRAADILIATQSQASTLATDVQAGTRQPVSKVTDVTSTIRSPGGKISDATTSQIASLSGDPAIVTRAPAGRPALDAGVPVRSPGTRISDGQPVRQPSTRTGDVAGTMLQPGRSGNDTTGGTRTTWRVGQAADRTQIGSTRTGIGRGNLLSASGGKRAFTGAEIALAAILVAAGTARVRKDRLSERELSEDGIITGQTILLDGSVLNEYHRPGDAVSLKGKEYSWNRAGSSGIGSDDCPDKEKPGGIVYGVLRRPSHIVAATDTLTGIADAIYGDSNLGWLIADLNAGNIKDTIIDGKRVVELKSRQKIDLPVWQDIVAFYENSPEGATPDNLITIVSETQIDREVIDDSLGIAVGASSRSQDPFHRNLASASVAASVQMAAEAQDAGENEPTIGSILNAGKAIHAFSGRFPGPPPTPGWVRLPQKMSV